MKQVKFKDLMDENKDNIYGGIMLDNGDVICGCCGSLFTADEENETWKLIETFDYWVNLSNEIIGE